jgi:hypothetical protein
MAAPTLTSTAPVTVPCDSNWHTVTFTGTNFATGVVVSSTEAGVHVTSSAYVSATSCTAEVLVDPTVRGAISLTFTNLDAGTVTTAVGTPTVTLANVTSGALEDYAVNPVPGAHGTSVAGTVSDNVVVALGPQTPAAAPFQDAISSPMESTHQALNAAWDPTNELAGGAPGGVQGSDVSFPGLVAPRGAEDTVDPGALSDVRDTEGATLTDHSAQLPGAPTTVAASAGVAGHATVTWVAPVDADGYAMTGFTVTATTTDAGTSPVALTVGNVLTADVSGLTSTKHYTFAVVATNIAGTGASSASTAAVLIA